MNKIKSEWNQGEMDLESPNQTKNKQILEAFTSKIKGAIFPAKLAISIFKQFQKREKYQKEQNIEELLSLLKIVI